MNAKDIVNTQIKDAERRDARCPSLGYDKYVLVLRRVNNKLLTCSTYHEAIKIVEDYIRLHTNDIKNLTPSSVHRFQLARFTAYIDALNDVRTLLENASQENSLSL